eukprot:TRINITY_DN4844_c0_g1_i3.p1 TRINITY_DN4844_c0_g1~~TRINITY_DN4844_c0_g1_i3.p1  ORF type:complete len:1456 (+),score=431.48 TRINITY_DN4844_c0_g1_i3:258-4625(+)
MIASHLRQKKFKSLVSYCESAPSAIEVKVFFEKEAYNVWAVFLDTFQHYEQQQKISKKDDKDIEKLLHILRRFLIYLPSKIKEKWQIRSISNILDKILYIENKHEIRMVGLELLLIFLEDLETPDPGQANLLGAAIDLEPFKADYQKKITLPFKSPAAADKNVVLFPSPVLPSREDSVALIGALLDYMGSHSNSFPMLWNLFRSQYLVLFFPDVCKDVGILDRFSDIGFPNHCPYDIVAVIVSKITPWANIDVIMKTIWCSKENTAIMMELFRQACILPFNYVDTTRVAVHCYRRLFLGTKTEKIPPAIAEQKEKLVGFQKFFVEQLVNVFKTPSNPATIDMHVTLCLEILQLFKQTIEAGSFTSEIRDVLLFTLLEITTTLLKPDTPNQDLAKALASIMVDVLLFTWISSKILNPEMWTRLHESIQSLFHRIEPVVQAKLKLVQLSLIVRGFIFSRPKGPKSEESDKLRSQSITPDYRKVDKSESDTAIASLSWDYQTAYFIWSNLLQIFRNVSRIKEPAIFSEAVGAIAEVADIFIEAENKASNQLIYDETALQPIHLLSTFGSWLFEACNRDEVYTEGKAKAFGSLCRLICRHYVPYPGYYTPDILPHFYTTLHYALCNPAHDSDEISWAIVENSSNIFNLALPGATILIPYYLVEINRLLRGHPPPLEVRRRGIIIVCSLISYASHFSDLEIPTRYYGHFQQQKGKELWAADESLRCLKFREQAGNILVHSLKTDEDEEIKKMCLWGICVLVFDCALSQPDLTFINDYVKILFSFALTGETSIALTSLEAISALSSISSEMLHLDKKNLLSTIIEQLCANILMEIRESKRDKEGYDRVLCQSLFCLADWTLAIPAILETSDLAKRIFQVIQVVFSAPPPQHRETMMHQRQDSFTEKKKEKRSKDIKDGTTSPEIGTRPPSMIITASPPITPKEAARYLLISALDLHKNFASLAGVEFSLSQVTESDDGGPDESQVTHFIYKNSALISCVEVTGSTGEKLARLFLRDATGRYAWNCRFAPTSRSVSSESSAEISLLGDNKPEAEPSKEVVKGAPAPARTRGSIILYEEQDTAGVDKIDELLQYLGETHPDCLPQGKTCLNQPTILQSKFLNQIVTMQKAFATQHTDDTKLINEKKQSKPNSSHWAIHPPKQPVQEFNPLQHCRLFLSHMGFLDVDNLDDIIQLENNKNFLLKLRNLDQTRAREIVKIGLVYVKEGQDDQQSIFRNETGSQMYNEFVGALGWPVPLATHKGYNGRLDCAGSNGKEAIYFTSPVTEIVYHEVVRMPTVKDDPVQLQKKRHVGNDIVHIIYTENGRDYSPKTISSQFNDAHIIINPLPNGMYRVQVAKKEKISLFGPIIHGMTLSKKLLPILVRLTAINANRCTQSNTESHRPFFARFGLIQEIITKCSKAQDYQALLESSFFYSDNQNGKPAAITKKEDSASGSGGSSLQNSRE